MRTSKSLLSFLPACGAYVAALTFATTANGVTVHPADSNWASGGNSGGGSSEITTQSPRNGNGSLELYGDRTRYFGLGNPFDKSSDLGLLKEISTFTYEWSLASDRISNLDSDYTPALRLHIWDGDTRSELIWEGAYNGTYGSTDDDTWYVTDNSDNFWQYVSGSGVTAIYDRAISDWKDVYSEDAYVSAVSVGVGSSVGSGYHAYADTVTLGFNGNNTTYNFETQSVPDIANTALLSILSFVCLFGIGRRLNHV